MRDENYSSVIGEKTGLSGGNWYSWSPRDELMPSFSKETHNNETVLRISSVGKSECYGKWLCNVAGIHGGKTYRFNVEYKADKIDSENVSIAVILTWNNRNGDALARDYADKAYTVNDGWNGLSRILEIPEQAASVMIELVLRWTPNGSVCWRNPQLAEINPLVHRKIRVATTLLPGEKTIEDNVLALVRLIDKAGSEKPDIICMGEAVFNAGSGITPAQCADSIPGKLTQELSGKALQYNSYIVFSMYEKDNGCIYNTAVLLDREGEISGKYRKTHLPLCEAEDGVTPGNDYPVFTTDFGKIGIMVCWDHWFPEVARILRKNGAEIMFIPTLGYVPLQARARAIDNGVFVVVSGRRQFPAGASSIIDPEGNYIGVADNKEAGYVIKEIDLDQRYLQEWLSVGSGYGESRSLYMKERRPDTYCKLLETAP